MFDSGARRLASRALVLIGSVIFASCGGGGALTITCNPPASTPADGMSPAILDIKVAQGSNPVPDANAGQVTVSTDVGQFAAYAGTNKDDNTLQSTTASLTNGEVKVNLFNHKAGMANVTIVYSDSNMGSATKKVTVNFSDASVTLAITVPTAATQNDGQTPAAVDIKAMQNGAAVSDSVSPSVLLKVNRGQFGPYDPGTMADDPTQQSEMESFSLGDLQAQVYSTHTGPVTLTATYSDMAGNVATKTATIQFGVGSASQPAAIQYLGANPPTINLMNSGGVTTTEVTFQVNDLSGQPVPDGITVDFTLSMNPGGAAISPNSAITANGNGQVKTILSAGTIPGTVKITASVGTITTQSDPIAIAGGGVNFKNLSLACNSYTIGGFTFFGLDNGCTVFASDVNGQFVQGTQIQVMSEAGSVPQTIQVSMAGDGSDRGEAQFAYQTDCPLPVDVRPVGGEWSATVNASDTAHAFYNQCRVVNGVPQPGYESRTVNPRDGYANLVVYTLGEECYNDKNRDGTFEPGEEDLANCDLGEPFLDENDNGRYDPPCDGGVVGAPDAGACDPDIPAGEPFFDYDSNQYWTPPNHQWDAQWPIWRAVTMVWTSSPVYDGTVPADPFPNPVGHCVDTSFTFEYADVDGNCPTGDGMNDTITLDCGSSNCIPLIPSLPYACPADVDANGLPAYTFGISDAHDCSTVCDPNAPYPDAGGNPCPAPGNFNVNVTIMRQLATDISGVVGGSGNETDSYLPVASGVYK